MSYMTGQLTYSTQILWNLICDAGNSARHWRGVLFALLLSMTFMETVLACQICVSRPTTTLADRLLSSDAVVLAREDPQHPFQYAAVESLKGDPGTSAIDVFINTPVRHHLARNPTSAMLLARDANSGDWRTLGIASGDFDQVVRKILTFADRWMPHETDNPQRLSELAQLLGHQDLRLHELAYLEIGRASYASIRSVGTDVPLKKVRAMLDDPFYIEWRGLDILLLGLSDAKQDHTRVIQEIQDRQRSSSPRNLDAWATAYVEVTGRAGIDQLRRWYFRNERRSRDELRAVIRALSVHATNTPELREPVVAAYRQLLVIHPDVAPDITHDLIAWRQWHLQEQLRQLQSGIAASDPLGAYAVKRYLQKAEAHSRTQSE